MGKYGFVCKHGFVGKETCVGRDGFVGDDRLMNKNAEWIKIDLRVKMNLCTSD